MQAGSGEVSITINDSDEKLSTQISNAFILQIEIKHYIANLIKQKEALKNESKT